MQINLPTLGSCLNVNSSVGENGFRPNVKPCPSSLASAGMRVTQQVEIERAVGNCNWTTELPFVMGCKWTIQIRT